MEYSILFLPLIGAIFGYLAKYFGDLTSTMESFTELTVTI